MQQTVAFTLSICLGLLGTVPHLFAVDSLLSQDQSVTHFNRLSVLSKMKDCECQVIHNVNFFGVMLCQKLKIELGLPDQAKLQHKGAMVKPAKKMTRLNTEPFVEFFNC